MPGTEVVCPFSKCEALVPLAHHRGLDLGTPPVDVIREHRTTPGEWFGTCPASLMAYPIAEHEARILAEMAGTYEAIETSRPVEAPPESATQPERPWRQRHRRDDDPYWFQNSDGDPQDRGRGPGARPILTLVQPDETPRGGAVASVSETRAMIAGANQLIAEGQQAARLAAQRFTDAQAVLAVLQGSTSQTLGGPNVSAAIDRCELAERFAGIAIETNSMYGARL